MRSKILRAGAALSIIMLNIGCDQISKSIVREKVDYNAQIGLIDHFLTLTKIENSGAFLSLGDSLPSFLKIILLMVLPVAAMAYALVFILTKTGLSKITLLGLCFVIGGGIGNIYDRILYGSVTDFLHMNFGIFQTGIFNMADVSVMAGMFILIFHIYLPKVIPTAEHEGI